MSRCLFSVTAALLALLINASPGFAQQGAPEPSAGAPRPAFDQEQCRRRADEFGQSLLDRIESAAQPSPALEELKAQYAKVRDALRDACAAAGALASPETAAAAEKLADAAREAASSLRGALEAYRRAEPAEQRRMLDAVGRAFGIEGLGAWLGSLGSPGRGDAPPRNWRFCIDERCLNGDLERHRQ